MNSQCILINALGGENSKIKTSDKIPLLKLPETKTK